MPKLHDVWICPPWLWMNRNQAVQDVDGCPARSVRFNAPDVMDLRKKDYLLSLTITTP